MSRLADLSDRFYAVLATFWIGAIWTVGWLAAPTLFALLPDRALAGSLAGAMLRQVAWLSIFVGIVLAVLRRIQVGRTVWRDALVLLPLAMLACALAGYFALQPIMADLRAQAGGLGLADAATRQRFAQLHGLSAAIYVLQSVLGLWLILRLGRGRARDIAV